MISINVRRRIATGIVYSFKKWAFNGGSSVLLQVLQVAVIQQLTYSVTSPKHMYIDRPDGQLENRLSTSVIG